MTLPTGRTPAPVDEEGALDFSERPARPVAPAPKPYPSRTFSTQVEKDGYTFTLSYSNMTLDNLDALVEELKERNYTAVKPAKAGGFGQRPDNRVDPAFDEAGNEICPVHKAKIREYKTQDGRTFKGCPSKGTGAPGEKLNARGYCETRFK